ncbi:hypothetical protein SAMN04489806_0493 [Paramicrobacterium humi]|uniref:Uncharacterized protein n=1 Tax=Paramicrobacterium humi TaxID=640635 RepID=A0A1H4J4S0_9MICO|nr:hypothetical protein [Microbacterium humi]SEB41294.1 hypothetical protein SAMN04489806_0493 [Microbacterium humi]
MTLPADQPLRRPLSALLRVAVAACIVAVAAALFVLFVRSGGGDAFGWGIFLALALGEFAWIAASALALVLAGVAAIRGADGRRTRAVVTAAVALALAACYVVYCLSGLSLLAG